MPGPGWHRTFRYMNETVQQFHDDRDSITIDGYQKGDHFESESQPTDTRSATAKRAGTSRCSSTRRRAR